MLWRARKGRVYTTSLMVEQVQGQSTCILSQMRSKSVGTSGDRTFRWEKHAYRPQYPPVPLHSYIMRRAHTQPSQTRAQTGAQTEMCVAYTAASASSGDNRSNSAGPRSQQKLPTATVLVAP